MSEQTQVVSLQEQVAEARLLLAAARAAVAPTPDIRDALERRLLILDAIVATLTGLEAHYSRWHHSSRLHTEAMCCLCDWHRED